MITGKLLYVSQHQSGFIWLHCDTNPQSENVVSSASLSHRLCQRILLRWNSPMVTPSLEVPGAPGLCACNFPWNFDEFAMETCFLEWKLVFYDVLFPSSFHRLSLIHWLIDWLIVTLMFTFVNVSHNLIAPRFETLQHHCRWVGFTRGPKSSVLQNEWLHMEKTGAFELHFNPWWNQIFGVSWCSLFGCQTCQT